MIEYFNLSEQDEFTLKDIIAFNDLFYPRRTPNDKYINYRFTVNPIAKEKKDFLYIASKNGKQVGQLFTMPSVLTYNNKEIQVFWGQNFIVAPEHRKQGIGKNLLEMSISKDYYMGFGMTSMSKNLHYSSGLRNMGTLKFYQKWNSGLKRLTYSVKRRLKKTKIHPKKFIFPQKISDFDKILSANKLNLPHKNWNKDTFETIRTEEFINWRFLHKPNRYFIYKQQDVLQSKNSPYFVVRPTVYLNHYWLQIIDYRFDFNNEELFYKFINAWDNLGKELGFFGTLVPSSQNRTSLILEKTGFKKYKERNVVSSYPFSHSEEEAHNQFVISPADSDWDMYDHFGNFLFK